VYSGADRLDVFCVGTDGHPWSRTWTETGGWSPWSNLGGTPASDPDAVSLGEGAVPRMVARGLDGFVYQWIFGGSSWGVQSWGQP